MASGRFLFKIIKSQDSVSPRSIPASNPQKHYLFVSLSTSARSQSFIFFLDRRFSETPTHTINLQPAVSNASEVDDTSQRIIFIKSAESETHHALRFFNSKSRVFTQKNC